MKNIDLYTALTYREGVRVLSAAAARVEGVLHLGSCQMDDGKNHFLNVS